MAETERGNILVFTSDMCCYKVNVFHNIHGVPENIRVDLPEDIRFQVSIGITECNLLCGIDIAVFDDLAGLNFACKTKSSPNVC